MTNRRKTSPEARKAEMEKLHQTMADQVHALTTSEGWRRWVQMAGRLHHYSLGNLLLILAQNEDATKVAGYRAWQAMGRQVRKGERGIRILGGRPWHKTETDEETGKETTTKGVRFFPCSVFDISQTDPIDGAEEPEEPTREIQGTDDAGIYARVAAQLTADGWTVQREQLPGAMKGATNPDKHTVTILPAISDAFAAAVILHEAAHIALGHTDDLDEYHTHRGPMEVEAESVAHILGDIAGLDTSDWSIGYVAGWGGWKGNDPDATMKATAARVIAVAGEMARRFGLDAEGEETEIAA